MVIISNIQLDTSKAVDIANDEFFENYQEKKKSAIDKDGREKTEK